MTDIQRYYPEGMLDAGYQAYAEMEEHPTGDYVLFSDHQARIEALVKERDEALAKLRECEAELSMEHKT